MKIKNLCKKNNNNGKSTVLTVVLILIILLIGFIFYEYLRLQIILKGVRDNFKNEMKNIATINLQNAYEDLREFNYEIDDDKEFLTNSSNEISNRLMNIDLNISKASNNNKTNYIINNIKLDVKKISGEDTRKDFRVRRYILRGELTLSIFLSSPFDSISPLKNKITIETAISSKY